MREAINIIWRLSVATELILTARLLLGGLGTVYPALTIASCVFALQQSFLIVSAHHAYTRSAMADAWKITEPLVWVLWCWVVMELFSKRTRSYRGIDRFGRYLFGALILVALMVSLIFWPFEWKALVFDHDFRVYFVLNRVLTATLALFTLLMWLFFRNYPAAVAPNVVRHTQITVAYFAANSLSQLAFNLNGPKLAAQVNLSLVLISAGGFAAWAILLTRDGEKKESISVMNTEEIAKTERLNQELLAFIKNLPSEIGARRN